MNTRFYLDTRSAKDSAPLKIAIRHKGKSAYINLDIKLKPDQWDEKSEKVTDHPQKKILNAIISKKKADIDTVIFEMIQSGEARRNANEVRDYIIKKLSGNDTNDEDKFYKRFHKFATTRRKDNTRISYLLTYNKVKQFDPDIETRSFEEVNKDWLTRFDNFMISQNLKTNGRSIHFRNIRAVFNDALDDEITSFYPFRKFKIKREATAKRSLTAYQLREIFSYPVEEHAVKYRDIFKLIFLLIGINVVDLCNLKEIKNGRIEYNRSKTNRLYSIKVEPEAEELIERYRGENYLLDILDTYSNYRDYAKKVNMNLQRIGPVERVGKGGKKIYKPLYPDISTYWARHSWATIAAELDIPKETIAAALGHGGNTVTDIYINFDQKKIDEANRKVIDRVLYDK